MEYIKVILDNKEIEIPGEINENEKELNNIPENEEIEVHDGK